MSKKRVTEFSLSEKLTSLIHTKPSEIESDNEDLTTAEKIGVNDIEDEYSADELDVPKFRKINDTFLDESDTKYLGKEVSRKDIQKTLGSDSSEIQDSTEEFESNAEDDSNNSWNGDNEVSSENESDSSKSDFEKSNQHKVKFNAINDAVDVNKEIFTKATNDIEKGKIIKNQLQLWDFLLECRMKIQNSIVASNQFPSYKNLVKFKNKGGSDFQESLNLCCKSLRHLLCSLLFLQDSLLKSNEDYLLSNNKKVIEANLESEEITSESDDGLYEKTNSNQEELKKLKKLNDFASEITKRHQNFEVYRNNVIQKWNDKTRIGYASSKNFSAFEQSTLKQIEHVLIDKQRLIRRTQTKRSTYHTLGQNENEPPSKTSRLEEHNLPNLIESKYKNLDKEIFDDDDFYHQLLSEWVKRKANDVTDPVQLGRQWMQLQKIRSKMKKSVDVKASKGRKIRFVVHPKLVNFMTPIDNSVYNEEAKIELYNSLFGKNKK